MTRDRAARIAAPLVAAALVLLATSRRGPALSPDSAVYLSVADHLAQGRGWVQFDGAPYVRWAPLYPLLLSLGPRLGLTADTVAWALQPLAFAATVALCGAWLARHVARRGWRFAALALVTLSTIGIESAAFVWAESLDLLCTLGCLVALDRWAEHGRARTLAAAAACAALACLLRYASAVLVPLGALAVLIAPRPRAVSWPARAAQALAFAVAAALPLAAWVARNAHLGEGPVGGVAGGGFSWLQLAEQTANAASHWAAPESSPVPVRAVALGLFVSAVVLTLVLGLARGPRTARALFPPALLLGFVGAHKLAVLAGAHATAVERIDERYLAPLFAPLVLALAWAADRASRAARAPGRSIATRALAVLAALWVGYTALRTADRERGYLGTGAWGYRNASWERSELVRYARSARPVDLVYSNAPDALYALARVEARLSPRIHAYNAPAIRVDDLRRFPAQVDSAGGARLFWFRGLDRPFLASRAELDSVRRFVLPIVVADGEIDSIPPWRPVQHTNMASP